MAGTGNPYRKAIGTVAPQYGVGYGCGSRRDCFRNISRNRSMALGYRSRFLLAMAGSGTCSNSSLYTCACLVIDHIHSQFGSARSRDTAYSAGRMVGQLVGSAYVPGSYSGWSGITRIEIG